MTIASTFYQVRDNEQLKTLTQVFLGSLLIALYAQIRIPLPFTPVPITLQTLAVMLVGAGLGSRKGALCVVLYLAESMLGLPVFAGGGVDPFALIGPTGGYLIGFIFTAYLVGWFAERKETIGKPGVLAGVILAGAVTLTMGTLWLAQFVGFKNTFFMGFLPFIPGDIMKSLIVYNFIRRNS